MSHSDQLTRSWKMGWVVLIVTAALISSRMAYIAPLFLAVCYPIAQSISIAFIPTAKYPAIWLIHIPYWLIILSFGMTENILYAGLFGSSVLGEILILIIVKNAVEWKWLLYNSCAMIVLILGYNFLSAIESSYYEYFPIIIALGILFGLSALVSVQGIQLKNPELENKKRSPLESDDL